MYNVTIFGINITVDPVAFTIPIGSGWQVYWYGIIIATGFLLAVLYGLKTADRYSLNKDKIMDGVLIVAPIAILCARIYYLIFDGEKLESIGDFFGFTSKGFSGLAIYGAVIGAIVSGAIVCKLFKMNVLDVFDVMSVSFLIGQAIGRWGNFVNQEAFGTLTNSKFWGMQSERTIAEVGKGLVHPCFLYESVWCVIGFFLLNHFTKKRQFKGQIVLMYCAWYGFGRAIIELLRTDSLMIGNLRVSFLLSLIICIGALVTLGFKLKGGFVSAKVKAQEQEYVPMFADIEDTEPEQTTNTGEDENGTDN
ncbi:MAG: prolipoprotein diacylglyceryl transferase [Clostridia bacterium]|nr:prolipoprotein diacylglyceryl transferase [Clostridia bacterium]